jgi:D-beta-D-heptose 7-phosphate kinase / D-beta-D-heptose 1-phosphate adenosyltransferase
VRIGFTNGCFDLFHAGHKHLLMQASERCDYLIVAVNSDASVKRLKGFSRPYDCLHKRMTAVHKYADAVIPFEGREEKLIMEIRPQVLFKGYDHSAPEFLAMRKPGWKDTGEWDKVEVIQISHLAGFSTTNEARSAHHDSFQTE